MYIRTAHLQNIVLPDIYYINIYVYISRGIKGKDSGVYIIYI